MSVKNKLTLTISLIVFLFLSLTVILNDYTTRVNLRTEAEADIEQYSRQVASAVEHYTRVQEAFESEMTERLRYASYTAADMLPDDWGSTDHSALQAIADRLRLQHVSLLTVESPMLVAMTSSLQGMQGQPIPMMYIPQDIANQEGIPLSSLPRPFYSSPWPVQTDDRTMQLWGYLQRANQEEWLAVALDVKEELGLLALASPESVMKDIVDLHPEIEEIAVLRDDQLLFGNYEHRHERYDEADRHAAKQGQIIYRQLTVGNQKLTVSTLGFGEEVPYVVRTAMNVDYLNEEIHKNRMNLVTIYAIVLILVILTSYWLSGVLIRPVQSILAKVNQVAAGVFDTPLAVERNDELGQLAERINTMVKNLDVYTNKLRSAFEENRSMSEYLESIINHTPDAIHIEELDGTIVRVNHAFEVLFGWTEEEAVGRRLRLVPERYRQEEQQAIEAMLSGTLMPARDTVRQRKDGTTFDVSVTTSPIRDKNGEVRAYASITRDVTSRNKMDELLRQAEKLNTVGQLAAGVAHEIRNPLTTLRGFVQLQQQTQKLNVRHSDLMLSELDRINLIVSEFLILAKPQATKFEIKDVRFVLGDVLSLLDSQAHLCNIIFTTSFVPEQCEVACEENQLKQVFINVLKNAIEAMPSGGTINIRVMKPVPDSIVVAITDEGIGIPEDMIPKLGDPFFTGKETGTGLGIMVSQRIIQSHHGSLQIKSKVDEGTEVTITLPAIVD